MKKYIKSILFLSLLLFVSCYEDKGNYTYDPVTLKVEGIELSYTIGLDSLLTISPKVSPENGDYEYVWGIYKQLTVEQGIPELTIISKEKDLKWVCSGILASNYPLVFIVKNKKTNVSKTVYAPLSVISANTIGWYVLKDYQKEGETLTDIDIFGADGKLENVIATKESGLKLRGKAMDLSFSNYYSTTEGPTLALLVSSNKDLAVFNINKGRVVQGTDQGNMFYEAPATMDVSATFGSNKKWYLVNNGRVHASDVSDRFAVPNKDEEVFKLSKQFSMDLGANKGIFFDEATKSFLCFTYSGDIKKYTTAEGAMSPTNTGKDLVMLVNIGQDLLGTMGGTYAIMKYSEDNTEGVPEEKRILLGLAASGSPDVAPIMMKWSLSEDIQYVWKADYWTGNLDDKSIMCHYNGKIYSLNPNGKKPTEKEILALKSDEKFCYMEHVLLEDKTDPEKPIKIDRFIIATELTDGTYRIYQYKTEYGNLILDGEVLTGTGKPRKVIYLTQWFGSLNS